MYHESIESVFFRLPPDGRFPIVRKTESFSYRKYLALGEGRVPRSVFEGRSDRVESDSGRIEEVFLFYSCAFLQVKSTKNSHGSLVHFL